MTPSKQPIKNGTEIPALNAAQRALKKIEEMGLNRFKDSSGIWDVETKRVNPASFFDAEKTPDVIANMMQSAISAKEPQKATTEGEQVDRTDKINVNDAAGMMAYAQKLWLENVVDPKFVDGESEPEKNILSINLIGLDVLMEYMAFQLSGAASVGVRVGGGVMTLEGVATFPGSQ